MDRQGKRPVPRFEKLDGIFFDLDGTLIDSSKDIATAANYALKKLGFSPLPEEEIVKHVGYGGERLMKGLLPVDDEETFRQAVKIFREYYFSNPVVYTKPYKGIPQLLQRLKKEKKQIAVITNKYEDISNQILEKLGLLEYINLVLGGDSVKNKKPNPEPVLKAQETLQTQNSVMVGDSETDINAAKGANIPAILVEYGFGNKELAIQAKPDFIASSVSQLEELLCG